jgi:hypothetical protein
VQARSPRSAQCSRAHVTGRPPSPPRPPQVLLSAIFCVMHHLACYFYFIGRVSRCCRADGQPPSTALPLVSHSWTAGQSRHLDKVFAQVCGIARLPLPAAPVLLLAVVCRVVVTDNTMVGAPDADVSWVESEGLADFSNASRQGLARHEPPAGSVTGMSAWAMVQTRRGGGVRCQSQKWRTAARARRRGDSRLGTLRGCALTQLCASDLRPPGI